jgi:osmotically-inducible protein OsmY
VSFLAPASDDREDSAGTHRPMIGRQAEIRIRGSSYLALRDVICFARGDILHLRGRLPSQYLKQVAQEIAAGVEGVRHVSNGIEVSARPARAPAGRRFHQPESDRVESNTSTTRGEGSVPSNTQGLKGVCDHVSSKPQAE